MPLFLWDLNGRYARLLRAARRRLTRCAVQRALSLPEKATMPCSQSFPDFVSEYRKNADSMKTEVYQD